MFDDDTTAGGNDATTGDATDDKAKDQKADDTADDLDKIEGLGDKGKEAIRKERDAAKAAAARAKDAETKLAALEKEKTDRETAEQARKDKEAAESGKWEELATKREGELKSAKDEAAALKGENTQLRTAITGVLDSEWKELPVEVKDAYLGADDDPLAKLAFLPKGKALAAKLADKETARGNGADPKSRGSGKVADADKQKAQASIYSRF